MITGSIDIIDYSLTIEVDLGLEDRELAALFSAKHEVYELEKEALSLEEQLGYTLEEDDVYIRKWEPGKEEGDILVELIALRQRIAQ